MGLRVIHHEGDKNLLLEMIKINADELKNDEDKDIFADRIWEQAIDAINKGNFSRSKIVPAVLSIIINNNFSPASDDHYIAGYEDLASNTSGKLADTLQMFVNGRNFSTGNAEFGDEMTCGYLSADEVREFLELIKAYTPDEDEEEFVNDLIDTFSSLVEKKSGDLFTMS